MDGLAEGELWELVCWVCECGKGKYLAVADHGGAGVYEFILFSGSVEYFERTEWLVDEVIEGEGDVLWRWTGG